MCSYGDVDTDGSDGFNGYGYFHVCMFCAGFGFQADIVEFYVLLSASSLVSCFQLSSDPDARHLGRYGPEGQVCSMRVWPRSSSNAAVALFRAGFAGYDASHAEFPLVVGRTGMLGILVSMDQKDRYAFSCCSHAHCVQRQVPWVMWCRKLRNFRSCISSMSSTLPS